MKLDAFIPGFLKKIDDYLLKNHPNLWVTNIHYVLFFTLLLDGVLFALVNLFSYQLTEDIPDIEVPFMLMILPAVLVFVFWFIKQARYNVDKNYGKSHIGHDYQNFLIYFVVIFLFYTVAAVIPHALVFKVKTAISTEELEEDIENLNKGYVYFTNDNSSFDEYYDIITIESRPNYVYTPGSYDREYDEYGNYIRTPEKIKRNEALLEIEDFIKAFNKYTLEKIHYNPQEVLAAFINNGIKGTDDYYGGHNYFYEMDNIDWKIEKMYRMKQGTYGFALEDSIYLKIIAVFMGLLALATWVFKNVHWKNFLAAGITVILSPFIMGLVGLILFVVIDVGYQSDDIAILIVIVLFNLASLLLFLIPYLQQRYSYMSVINGMLIQLWTPFSIFIYSILTFEILRNSYYYDYYDGYGYGGYYSYWDYYGTYLENTYWIGWGVALVSIALMKQFYKRMWALPKRK